jgi:predicted transcriptional regulator
MFPRPYLNRPHDFHEFIRVIEQADIEREYIETMQTVAQHLRAEGMQQGMQAGIYAVTKNMIQQGSDEQFISLVTGLSKEKIKELKEALHTQE